MKPAQIYIIQNPVAGTSDPDHVKNTLIEILTEEGIRFQIYQTSPQDDLRELSRQAALKGYRQIWAAGGDGTVSAVANGLIGSQTSLGIIPVGSGNILARELGLPLNVAAACYKLLNETEPCMIDAIRVKDTYYILAVSAGVGAKTMAETNRSQKRRLGQFAYLINGARLLLSRAIWPFKVEIDSQIYRIRATEIIATNAGIIGFEILRWGNNISLDDGLINLCYVRINSVPALLRALRGAALDQQDQVKELSCLDAREEIIISSRHPVPIQGDGEAIGTTPVHLKVVPSAVSVLTPL